MRTETIKLLDNIIAETEQIVGAIRLDTETVLNTGDPIEVVKHFDILRIAQDRIKTARKALEEITDALSMDQIPTLFTNRSLKTINIEGVGRCTVSYRWSASILDDPKKGKQRGHDWLKANGYGDIIKPTVNAQTLAATAKELFQNEEKDLPPELFKVGQVPYTSITKS